MARIQCVHEPEPPCKRRSGSPVPHTRQTMAPSPQGVRILRAVRASASTTAAGSGFPGRLLLVSTIYRAQRSAAGFRGEPGERFSALLSRAVPIGGSDCATPGRGAQRKATRAIAVIGRKIISALRAVPSTSGARGSSTPDEDPSGRMVLYICVMDSGVDGVSLRADTWLSHRLLRVVPGLGTVSPVQSPSASSKCCRRDVQPGNLGGERSDDFIFDLNAPPRAL
jgi:hypothetical protein